MKTKEEKREYHRQYRAKNLEHAREYSREYARAWRAAHPEEARKRSRDWRSQNPECGKAYNALNVERRRAWARLLAKTDKGRERTRRDNKRRSENPLHVFRSRISARLRATLANIGGQKSNRQTEALLGFTKQALHDHLAPFIGQPCGWCEEELKDLGETSIDHIIPICTAKTELEIISLNQLSNLRLIHKVCNSIKGSKLPNTKGDE